jgi:hypothetical protein
MTMTKLGDDAKTVSGKDPTAVVEELAGSSEPLERVMARLIATGATDTFDNWLWAEYERGTKPVDIITAYLNFNVSIMARIATTCIIPGYEHQLVKAMKEYAEHLPVIVKQYNNPVVAADGAKSIPVQKGKSPWLTPES